MNSKVYGIFIFMRCDFVPKYAKISFIDKSQHPREDAGKATGISRFRVKNTEI